MTVKEFLKSTINVDDLIRMQMIRPRAKCNDGFSISVQASFCHYCEPRQDGLEEYDSVELGYPSSPDKLIADYAEDDEDLTNTVYGYVPIDVVEKLIEKHGGIAES